jgi:site-specific DNA recombinase
MTNVAAYLRVSTTRQAEHDLSLPDQLSRIQAYCESQGWTLTEVFEERGASGTSINRPELQQMLARATSHERPFDIIMVYSLSRLVRSSDVCVLIQHKLAKRNVKIVSLLENYSYAKLEFQSLILGIANMLASPTISTSAAKELF